MAERLKVLLTTSRRPTANIRTLCRDFSFVFPNVVRTNRGKSSLEGVAEKALEADVKKVMIIDRWEKGFGKIEFFTVEQEGVKNVLPIIYLRSVKLRRDFGKQRPNEKQIKSVAVTSVSKENFEAKKLEDALAIFFCLPSISLGETLNANCDSVMQISMDLSTRMTITFKLVPELIEVGPQIEVSHLVWELRQ